MDPISAWATAAGLAWASGIRLYAVLFITGALHALGWISLPPALQVLADPRVLAVAGSLVMVEFLADKIPLIDSIWDAVHTFIRVPAGALLAAGVFESTDGSLALIAALLGGTLAGSSHLTKAGSRILINTSPEPISNWTASLTEDALVPATLLVTFMYPLLLIGLLGVFCVILLWLAPKLLRAIYSFIIRSGRASGSKPSG